MGKVIDLTGQRFGRLVVIERAENGKRGKARWLCQCDCGNTCIVDGNHLRSGKTKSCGCVSREATGKRSVTHGHTRTRLYRIWSGIIDRCENPKTPVYQAYGGRGIRMCAIWRQDFTSFRDWAMSHGYRDDLTIDRIDVDGDYCPENCRWADWVTQQNNRRNNRCITFLGETKDISQWARTYGIEYSTLYQRLLQGWPIERALTEPVHEKNHRKKK